MNDSQSKSLNDAILLKRSIERGDLEEVKKSLLSSRDKYFFDDNRLSAAAYAIKLEKYEIYEFLVSQGIRLGPHELMDEITNRQKRKENEKLRDIHKKYLKTPSLKHLANLNSSSRLSHEASPLDRQMHLQLIAEAFEDLNGLSCIEPILKVASTAENLKIVFDFNRDSVEFVAPGKSRNVMGTSFNEDGHVYVGAKDLIRNENVTQQESKQDQDINEERSQKEKENDKRCQVLGVLIHELTHFVMKLIYGNESKPYKKDDQDKLEEFNEVVTATQERINEETEPFIISVFDYPDTKHHAELIVRVPHLTALYKDDEIKYMEVLDEFPELFDFYETKTLIDIKNELPVLEAKNEIREINESCGTLEVLKASDIEMTQHALEGLDLSLLLNEKIILISSNCHQLTMIAILQLLCSFDNFESSYIFADLKTIAIPKIFDFVIKAFKTSNDRTLIIDCEGERQVDDVMKIVQKLNEQQISIGVVFVSDKISSLGNLSIKKIKHTWTHLTKSFQKKLLNEKILFHGIEMRLEELLDDLSSIESIPFENLICNQKIVIGKDFNSQSLEKVIERKFLRQSSRKISSENYSIEHDFDELLNFANDHRTVLISDEPGMGKSTSLKILQSKLRSKFSSSWIILMDLKTHFESYETFQPDFKSREEIAKYFCDKILKTEKFETEIFMHLFCNDRVILLMDGLDEICPTYKQFIFGLMSDIQALSTNQLWVSTRPHLIGELIEILKPITFTLKPFTEANRREFFEKYYSGDPNLEQKLKEIESFMEKLNPHGWQDRSVSNPLVMKMILENLDENQDLKLSESNLFSIYDQFTKKLVRKCVQEKGPEANNDISNSFDNLGIVEFHLKTAFELIFSNDDKLGLRSRLIDPLFQFVSAPPLDEIVRVGLMFADGYGDFNFIHRTFAEFFIAKYFHETIFAPQKRRIEEEIKSVVEILLDGVLSEHDSSFNFIRILLDSALEIRKSFKKVNLSENVSQFIEMKLKVEHFEHMIKSGCLSLVKAVALQLSSDSQLLFETDKMFDRNLVNYALEHQPINFLERFFTFLRELNSCEFERMFFELDNQDRNVFFFAAENDSLEVFNFLINQAEFLMTKEKFADLFLQHNYLSQNILHSAVRWDRTPKNVIEVLKRKLNPRQQRSLLERTDRYGQSLLQFASGNMKSGENLKSLLIYMREVLDSEALMKNLLFEDLKEDFKAFDFAIVNESESVYKVVKEFYLENFESNKLRHILFEENHALEHESSSHDYPYRIRKEFLKHYFYEGTIQRLYSLFLELFKNENNEIFKQFFLALNENGDTLLMTATIKFNQKHFDSLWSHIQNFDADDQKEVLEFSNSRGECAFHFAARNKAASVFQKVCDSYKDSFAKPHLRDLIVSCEKNWLFDIVSNNRPQNYETFSLLCSYLKELFKDSQKVGKLRTFFTVSNEAGRTIFMETAKNKSSENFVIIFNLCKELFSVESTKKFLLQNDLTGNSAFSESIAKDSASNFEIVKNAYEEVFERKQIQEIALTEVDGRNILSFSILKSSSLNLFLNLCNYLIQLLANEEIKLFDLFMAFDRDGETLLMQAARARKNYFEILSNIIENLFENKMIEEIIQQRNFKGATAFHFVVGNKDKSISKCVSNLYLKTLGIEVMKEMISKSF